ncbi:MAG TPA: alpha/beta hydrolase [Burkholderiaceae bacterium]|jgi:pimeloyl-ACP methyl ester carboxylesterase
MSEGSSPIWILLRGLSRESGHWGQFPAILREELQAQQPGARLLMLDLPGNGRHHHETSPTQVAAIVEFCRAELARLGVRQPVHLLAMSLGAMVTSDWATRYPQEVSAAVLINTSLKPFRAVYRRPHPFNYLALMLLSLTRLGLRRREARVLSLTTRMLPQPGVVLDDWVELQRKHPTGLRNTVRQLLAGTRYRASRVRPGVPLLLLCSQADALVDWRCSQAISRAWGAPLRLHTQAGHDLPLDDGLWVARAVRDWLGAQQLQPLQQAQTA